MHIVGDPHLGRVFKANVPIERRGDRECMMMEHFRKELATDDDMIVIIGDLFEHPIISTQVLFETAEAIQEAASDNKHIIIIAGNHDIDKNSEVKGSFHLLSFMLAYNDNVTILFKPSIINNIAFFPWEYGRTALEQLNDFPDFNLPPTAIGHWDLADFGGDISHLVPATNLTARGVTKIISGHWHVRGDYIVDGIHVDCTGSMEPMTHAEDPDGKLYVTLTLKEYEDADPATFKDKYIRVKLLKGEEVSPPPTCLGFKVEAKTEDQEVERVTLGDFDLKTMLTDAFSRYNITKEIQKEISSVVT